MQEHILMNIPLVKEPISLTKILVPKEIFPFCNDIVNIPQECFFVISLSAKQHIIERRLISMGNVDTCLAAPKEIFQYPIQIPRVKSVLLIHNHPSQDLTPSTEDIRITRQLVEAGKILNIPVQDHIIVGNEELIFSMRESGLVSFN